MRWGITDSMSGVDVCMEELKISNETSFGPSFIVIIYYNSLYIYYL